MAKKEESIVDSFADLKDREPIIAKSAGSYILEVVKKSPKKDWNQKEIREELLQIEGAAHSNPAINGALRKLADVGLLTRTQQSKHVFYRHMPKSKQPKESE